MKTTTLFIYSIYLFIFCVGQVTMLEVPLLTADECRAVAHATAEAVSIPGFVPSISVFDPDTEVPVQDLPDEVHIPQQQEECRAAARRIGSTCQVVDTPINTPINLGLSEFIGIGSVLLTNWESYGPLVSEIQPEKCTTA